MRTSMIAILAAAILSSAAVAHASTSGYPSHGKAIDALAPDTDYSDVVAERPRAVSIMRARAQGFVPSPQLHDYVLGVLNRELANVRLPPTFKPDVRILAAPEFTALCTPDGTIVVTVGLLEQLENEDELAFVVGHEVSHAIYRHHDSDWFVRAQYYAVVNGAAVDQLASNVSFGAGANIARGFDAASHLYKLSANVLAPQMTRGQEDAADALGFDLMVRAGYDPEAALGLMDVLAEQEAEAARAAAEAKAAQPRSESSAPLSSGNDFLGALGGIAAGGIGLGQGASSAGRGGWLDLGLSLFDSAVDSLSDQAASHHPATEREELLSAYAFREYRDIAPANPTPLAWGSASKSPLKPALTKLLSHYAAAEDAAGFIADSTAGNPAVARASVQRAVAVPTSDHAYTEFVASELYEKNGNAALSQAALTKAVSGSEPSWQVYARLIDIYIARNDYPHAQVLMADAVRRFEDSPVLLPKRIGIAHAMGDQPAVQELLPKCDAYDIRELNAECKKAAGEN
jgi:predicted Zn-dependent protease